jgi:hypothetical protein
MSLLSRFNPTSGVVDFWQEFRKPNPYRWPILLASMIPIGVLFYWLSSETFYKDPERPEVVYITTFDPNRTDAEIIASNEANQEVKELRAAREAEVEQRKRELYMALGAATGMDVETIAAEADAKREAEAAEEAKRIEARTGKTADDASEQATQEGPTP